MENKKKKMLIAIGVSSALLVSGVGFTAYNVLNRPSVAITSEEGKDNIGSADKEGEKKSTWWSDVAKSVTDPVKEVLGKIGNGSVLAPNVKELTKDVEASTLISLIDEANKQYVIDIPILSNEFPSEASEVVSPSIDSPVEVPITPPVEFPEEVPVIPPIDLLPEQPLEPIEPELPKPPIIINSKPVIYGQDEIVILKGTTFQPLMYVIAKDREDGNITNRIRVIDSNVNTEVSGRYFVEYQVEDSGGMMDTKHVQVIVNTQPIIYAQDMVLIEGEAFDSLINVTAIDEEDGDITSSIRVISNNVDVNMPGKYTVVYEVTDSNGTKATKQIVVRVKENYVPVILAEDMQIIQGESFDPLANVKAMDKEDGDITSSIRVISNNVNVNMPGKYIVVYEVTDSNGAKVTKQIIVRVKANYVPVILAEDMKIIQGESFDPLANVTAMDKEDGDITSSIRVISNNVDVNMPGKYTVVYEVTDSNGAKATKQIIVRVKENYASVILAEDMKIIQGESFDPLANVKAMDREDGDITSSIQVISNNVDVNTPGEYEVVYEVTDRHGATTTKHIVVTVIEDNESIIPDEDVTNIEEI